MDNKKSKEPEQLRLFPERTPKHYDRDIPQKSYKYQSQNQQIDASKQIEALEDKVIGEYVDIRIETDEAFKKFNTLNKYADTVPEQKKMVLRRLYAKFRGQGKTPQDISNYDDARVSRLFNRMLDSYKNSFNKKLVRFNEFYERNESILKRHNL
ncbi:hypothetical protein KO361_03420 [Candidatus Woesearchaeota archaeon]|nr:hypothetical protein [Candidatus Woesearchaeota archaeon]